MFDSVHGQDSTVLGAPSTAPATNGHRSSLGRELNGILAGMGQPTLDQRDRALDLVELLSKALAQVRVVSGDRGKFDSSRHVESCDERKKLTFRSITEVMSAVGEAVAWELPGYVARGSITLLAGRPKVGKTTLLFGLLLALVRGTPFLDRATNATKIVFLSEERPGTLAAKVHRFRLSDSVHVLLRHDARDVAWPDVVAQAIEHAVSIDATVLVIDTLSDWSGLAGDSENSAGAVLEAIRPLQDAAARGLAVIIVAHQRKMAGEYGEAIRGSSALAGAVDIIVELERPANAGLAQENTRVLRAVSRFGETPTDLVIKLSDEGYEVVGDSLQARGESESQQVLAVLTNVAQTTGEIAEAVALLPKATIHKRLNELVKAGKVERAGSGKKGDPFTWKIHSSQESTCRDETNPDHGNDPDDDSEVL